MNGKFHSAKSRLVAAVFFAIVAANCGIAADAESPQAWKCTKLLDSQTKSDLAGYERFFNGLFTLPGEYDRTAAREKSKLVGDKSYGSSGNSKAVDLGNGVTVWLPSWKALRPDGTGFEGKGIRPDVYVRTSEWRMRGRDRVLENALRLLRREADNRSEPR